MAKNTNETPDNWSEIFTKTLDGKDVPSSLTSAALELYSYRQEAVANMRERSAMAYSLERIEDVLSNTPISDSTACIFALGRISELLAPYRNSGKNRHLK